jgi:hypothetical protein
MTGEDLELLGLLGLVEPPSPRALDDAREALWSAVAAETLGTDPAPAPRLRRDPPRQARERRAEPDS